MRSGMAARAPEAKSAMRRRVRMPRMLVAREDSVNFPLAPRPRGWRRVEGDGDPHQLRRLSDLRELRRALRAGAGGTDPLRQVPGADHSRAARLSLGAGGSGGIQAAPGA